MDLRKEKLGENQQKSAYEPIVEKLRQNKRVLLMGEAGIGKTKISTAVAEDIFPQNVTVLFMQEKFVREWENTLEFFYNAKNLEIRFDQKETWPRGLYCVLKTSTFHDNSSKDIRDFFVHFNQNVTNRKLYLFIDLNYFLFTNTRGVYKKIGNCHFKDIRPANNNMIPILQFLSQKIVFCVIDECDIIRSETGKKYREGLKEIIQMVMENIPILFISATPLGGQQRDAQQICELLKCVHLSTNLVKCTRLDIKGTDWAPQSTYLVNIYDASKWHNAKVGNLVKLIIQHETEQEENTANFILHTKNRIFAALKTIEINLSNKNGTLITGERVLVLGLLKLATVLIYTKFESLEEIPWYAQQFFKKNDNEKYEFQTNSFTEPFLSYSHTGDPPKLKQTIADFEYTGKKILLNEARKMFNENVIQVYFQGLFAGSRNWSAVPVGRHRIISVLLHGISMHYVELIQAVGRNNRFSSPKEKLCLVLCFVLQNKQNINQNFFNFEKKEVSVSKVLNEGQNLTEFKITYKHDLFLKNFNQWVVEVFPPISLADLMLVLQHEEKSIVCRNGLFFINSLSINCT